MQDEIESAAPHEADNDAEKSRLGETLRAAREARRLSVGQASELLRIEPRFLIALEEERFRAIGPPVFVKGYLKRYCELLGLDPRPLLESHEEALGKVEPNVQARRSVGLEERTIVPRVAAAVGLAAAALLAWQFGGPLFDAASRRMALIADSADAPADFVPGAPSESRPEQGEDLGSSLAGLGGAARMPAAAQGRPEASLEPSDSSPPAVDGPGIGGPAAAGDTRVGAAADPAVSRALETSDPLPEDRAAADAPPAAARADAGQGPTGSASDPGEGDAEGSPLLVAARDAGGGVDDRPAAPRARDDRLPAPRGARDDPPPAGGGEAGAGGEDSGLSVAADGGAALAGRSPLEIELHFVEDSWTEVVSAAGERLYYGLARAGGEERVAADGEVRVLLGNADGVVLRVNGEPFSYPAGSRRGDLARFTLAPPRE